MKTISHHINKRNPDNNLLHIETEGCIVNIRIGLTNSEGKNVTSVEILPDQIEKNDYWDLVGTINNRIIKRQNS